MTNLNDLSPQFQFQSRYQVSPMFNRPFPGFPGRPRMDGHQRMTAVGSVRRRVIKDGKVQMMSPIPAYRRMHKIGWPSNTWRATTVGNPFRTCQAYLGSHTNCLNRDESFRICVTSSNRLNDRKKRFRKLPISARSGL